jgi:hypothetical protein
VANRTRRKEVLIPLHSIDYPAEASQRNDWVVSRRPARRSVDASRPRAFFVEDERTASGEIVAVATIFLTNKECPWRCVFCDLWKLTLQESVPTGAIPAQIEYALARLPRAPALRHLKLYNSGSFFDRAAVPPEDHPAIAARLRGFERVIVECHPALVNERVLRFRDLLPATTALEVAMGLETAHPEALAKLNKRMTLEDFARAAAFLRTHGIALRAFALVQPPFLREPEALPWAQRSVDYALDQGAGVVSLIPVRGGNGALEALAAQGQFTPPPVATLEAAAEYGIGLGRGRVFADLWDLEKFSSCAECLPERRERLRQMNLTQTVTSAVRCPGCG